jgi:hypothetical protein
MFSSTFVSFNVLVQVPGPAKRTVAAVEGAHVAFGLVLVDKLMLGQMRFQFEAALTAGALKRPYVYLKHGYYRRNLTTYVRL